MYDTLIGLMIQTNYKDHTQKCMLFICLITPCQLNKTTLVLLPFKQLILHLKIAF